MPKLLRARPPLDAKEERQVRKLAGSRHAPVDWIRRARMIARSWDGLRTAAVAQELGCHLQTVRGRLLVIWDGAPIHHCQAVKDFLAAGAARRLQLERLPGYAPEFYADKGVWNLLKRVELKNRCCPDLAELRWELGLAIRRLRRKRGVLRACFARCGYA